MSGFCSVDDVCTSFPQFQRDANNSIQDSEIQRWIDNRKARIRSALMTRGFDPDNPPTPLTTDQTNFLRSLNLDGAIGDLGDALQVTVTLQPGEFSLSSARRASFERVLKEINAAAHDRLFQPLIARTREVKPLLGGIAGAETDPDAESITENRSFFKNRVF